MLMKRPNDRPDPTDRREMRRGARCIAALLAAGAILSPVAAQASTLEALLSDFAKLEYLHTKFVEEKRIALLAAPLISEGALRYAQPGLLLRTTSKPETSRLLIRPEALYMGEGKRAEKIDFGSNPVVRSFVDSFLLLLDGDHAGLKKTYEVRFEALEGKRWRLELAPKHAPMTKMIKSMRFVGAGLVLQTLTVFEVSGDETETRFAEVSTKPLSKREIDTLFAAPSK